jgi:hypothetical protein
VATRVNKLLVFLALLVLTTTASCAKEAPPIAAPVVVDSPRPEAARPARPARDEIIETVLASEKALLEDGDVDAHLAAWAPDAVIIRARARAPGRYDVTVSVDRLRPTLRMIVGREARRKVDVDKVEAEAQGDEGHLTWRSATSEKATDYFREAFKLRRTRDGWRVVEKRYWPTAREEESGETHKFSQSTFDEMDRHVEAMRASGDDRRLLYALFGAYRFDEALVLARAISKKPNLTDKWLWEMLALSALMMGEAEEAAAAYARAADSP